MDRMSSRMRLQDSVLVLDPLDLGFAGGTIQGTVRLDARQETIDAAAKLPCGPSISSACGQTCNLRTSAR
jgi:uncharacterized protein involved in outer membrane biogenesis